MVWTVHTALLMLILVLSVLIRWCGSDEIMDMLSQLMDLKELAKQAAKDASEDDAAVKDVDRTYPVASVEMDVLLQMYRDCRTEDSRAMRTWCFGPDGGSYLRESNESKGLCPRGVTTHPCTGRILHGERSSKEEDAEFLWPWEGLRCDAFTEPTTVTHVYLPQDSLQCELAKLDLSVMVSLEQLDLSGNKLFGDFPDWLGDMTMLRLLSLNDNRLKGDIPSSFAGNDALEQINLSNNSLTASTLRFFDAFRRLQHLDISSNNIDLRLPTSLFASEFLRNVNISHNAFRGDLPKLPVFKFLESFDVSNNLLTGTMPSQLTLWGREDPHDPDENSSLSIVDVSHNLLTGSLPFISNQSVLQRFNTRNNGFSGLIPNFSPSLLQSARPDDFAGNLFLCPVPAALLPSNLTCICGDGYTTKSANATVQPLLISEADASVSEQLVLASEFANVCVRCPDGSYSSHSTRQKCRSCPPGSAIELSSSDRAVGCKLCAPGTIANESASLSCTPCPPGTYATSDGATSCNLCNPGEFTAQSGSTSCTACPVGTYSNLKGTTNCTSCPAGTYVNVEGEAECLLCPSDTYQDVAGSKGCKSCPIGSIAPQRGRVKCSLCPPGTFYDVSSKTCSFCHPGTFAKASAQTSCSTCAHGTVAEVFGSDKCLSVAAPGSGFDASSTLVQCKPGTFNDGKWRTCQPCPLGTFAANKGSRTCSLCAKGSFAASIGSARCKLAPRGSFVQFEGANRTELCGPNYIAATNGSTICTKCVKPSFSFLPGGVECSAAKPGEVYDHVEWPRSALDLAGVDPKDFIDTSSDQVAFLIHTWEDLLTSYLGLKCSLHVLQVKQLSSFTRIVVAIEANNKSVVTQRDNSFKKNVGDAIQHTAESAEKALTGVSSEFDGFDHSSIDGEEKDVEQLRDLITSRSFHEDLVRQINRANQIKRPLSYSMVNLTMVEPQFRSTRAVACAPGTFFSATDKNERTCLPCPVGSFSKTSGALQCEHCPQRTLSSEKGQTTCRSCPLGADAAPGSSSCVECSWFTYECHGFWQDLIAAMCVGAALLRMLYQKIRNWSVGDQAVQQQDESVALMAAVRTHGRTFDNVQYAPMGMISVDALFGSKFESDERL